MLLGKQNDRRSAIAARIRIRKEWSELKGHDEPTKTVNRIPEIIRKQQKPVRSASKLVAQKVKFTKNNTSPKVLKKRYENIMSNVPISDRNMEVGAEALAGVVVLVDVGKETRALALRAALMALGATVVPAWSPFVTHLVWTQGGCRDTRAKARALACRLVSPLWVEACASCGRRVTESAFPAAARASDLPSPRALRIMLKRAEAENIPLADLLNNKEPNNNPKEQRLRISSETEQDTTADTSTDHDTSTDKDTSHDRSKDSTDPTIRVNTLPRGGAAKMATVETPAQPPKSRRKLFTQKEAQDLTEDDDDTPAVPKRTPSKLTVRERKDLARAERMARRMLGNTTPAKTITQQILSQTKSPTIVLTGMSRTERQAIQTAIKSLNGRVQKHVNPHTTHVVLGSCVSDRNDPTGIQPLDQSHCSKINTRCQTPSTNTRSEISSINTRSEIPSINTRSEIPSTNTRSEIPSTNTRYGIPSMSQRCGVEKARTLNALLGAARGCRVVYSQWVTDSVEVKKWVHHHGYEVSHLRKISQKARVERSALGRTCSDYAYDVFRGMRVRISPHTEQKDAAIQLLILCGGVVQDGGQFQDGGGSQDGGTQTVDFDVCVGNGEGEVSSKWVFDSVAAGRMRTTRRYVNYGVENAR
ncbi:microcephalin-like isoform X2 [Cydia strobilella]|uniref:microcephalin-like isoform X2 n=1 Tax=Cydia strobilella TaxID=1100964 RepID=UPI0030052D31